MVLQELLRKVQRMRLTTRLTVEHRLSGEFAGLQRGVGMEFEQVRLYQPGDDVRTIDWNVSARMQVPYVKEFRQLKELTLHVLVDLSASGWYGQGTQLKRYVAYELAAVLAYTCMREQHRIGLMGYTATPELLVAPGKGKRHMVHLLQQLVAHVPQQQGTSLAAALDKLAQVQRSKALVVVLSDFLDSDYIDQAKRLLHKHELMFIRLYHPQEDALAAHGMVPIADVEQAGTGWLFRPRLARARAQHTLHLADVHRELSQFCQGTGIRYLSLDITQDYAPKLEAFFSAKL